VGWSSLGGDWGGRAKRTPGIVSLGQWQMIGLLGSKCMHVGPMRTCVIPPPFYHRPFAAWAILPAKRSLGLLNFLAVSTWPELDIKLQHELIRSIRNPSILIHKPPSSPSRSSIIPRANARHSVPSPSIHPSQLHSPRTLRFAKQLYHYIIACLVRKVYWRLPVSA
jgi:hypothetical protein